MENQIFLAHSTGEYLHFFPHSMDSSWWAYFLAHPAARLTNFQFTPHSKRGRSMINLSLFAGYFTVSSMVFRNFTLNRITYNAVMPPHLFKEVDWSTMTDYHHRLHLYVSLVSPLTGLYLYPVSLLHFSLSFPVYGCVPHWITLDTLLHCFWDGGKPTGTISISLKCGFAISVKTLLMAMSPCPQSKQC